jgi:hypothetical protein
MSNARDNLNIPAELLHVDRDGEEIDLAPKFNWRSLYGYS